MPFLKETTRSVRMYFMLVGTIAVFSAIGQLRELDWRMDWPTSILLAIYVPLLLRLVLGAAFVLAGFWLPRALLRGAIWVQRMLVIAALSLLLDGALLHAASPELVQQHSITSVAFGIAILIYLLRSVRRLAIEARTRAAIPDVPAARVAR
jgi:hypothetical protein